MNGKTRFSLIALTLVLGLALLIPGGVLAQDTSPPTETAPAPSRGYARPLVVVSSYSSKPHPVGAGKEFVLDLKLLNQGQSRATNLIIVFPTGSFLPRGTGGVQAVGALHAGESVRIKQPFTAAAELKGQSIATLDVQMSYSDDSGATYNESFSMAVSLADPQSPSAPSGPRPSPTPTVVERPQLVIHSYGTDVDVLKPGTPFTLSIEVENAGNANARRVTMVAGGATVEPVNPDEGAIPQEGVGAADGEFTNFSPLGTSNVQFLGDLLAGASLRARQSLIVNVTTNPGAYSFKLSFVYLTDKGVTMVDDQVITLLVFGPPVLEVSFYRDPGPLFVGQPNMLPIQIVNLGRKGTVLGNMRVTSSGGLVENASLLVGSLDAGGYLTLDAMLIPDAPGSKGVDVTVDYTDDFNRAQTLTWTLPVEVMEAPPMEEPPMEGAPGEPGVLPGEEAPGGGSESLWQKVIRFVRGMVGLDSGPVQPSDVAGEVPPVDGGPFPGEGLPPSG